MAELAIDRASPSLALTSLEGMTEWNAITVALQEVRGAVDFVVSGLSLPLSRRGLTTTATRVTPGWRRWRTTGSRCFAAAGVKARANLHVPVGHGRACDGAGREQQTFLLYGFKPELLVITRSFPDKPPWKQLVESLRRSKVRTVVM